MFLSHRKANKKKLLLKLRIEEIYFSSVFFVNYDNVKKKMINLEQFNLIKVLMIILSKFFDY